LLRADVVDALNERRAAKESRTVDLKRMMSYLYAKINQQYFPFAPRATECQAELQQLSPTTEYIKPEGPAFGESK
jgi:hypothetical protein